MAIKEYQPITAGRRGASVLAADDIHPNRPWKALRVHKRKHAGRNNQGKITVRHRGGGAKQLYRIVDFGMEKHDIPAVVETLEYDPNRTARIARVRYRDGVRRYILAPHGLQVGNVICASRKSVEMKTGNRTTLEHIPSGIPISNIELVPGHGGKIVRSAGASATVMSLEGSFAQVRLPSGEIRLIPKDAMATIGQTSNPDWRIVRLGKAGRMRYYGIRPRVRGKVMNPVDHPHGGGEGKHPIGMKHPKTPWGKPALGVPTRKKMKSSNRFILKRRTR
jgi:large subunit ribosomal protein L2